MVAGLEPELTNQFLQQLGKVASPESRGGDEVTEKENKVPAEDQSKPEDQAPAQQQQTMQKESSPPQSRAAANERFHQPSRLPAARRPEKTLPQMSDSQN